MDRDLIALAESLMAAAVDPAHWDDALRKASAYLGCMGVALETVGLTADGQHRIIVNDYQAAMETPAAAYYLPRNPRMRLAMGPAAAGVMYDAMLGTDAENQRDPFYAEFMRPLGLTHYAARLMVNKPDVMIAASLHRSPAQGHIEKSEIDRFNAVAPLLARAIYAAQSFEGLAMRPGLDLYDQIGGRPRGICVLSGGGRLLCCNRIAEQILTQGRGLTIRNGRLRALTSQEDVRLQALIKAVATRERPDGGGLTISASPGAVALAVLILPATGISVHFAPYQPAVIAIIADPAARLRPSAGLLRDLFDLTPREAEVAARIAAGEAVSEIAEAMGVGMATVRSHLNAIFQKTGTDRQADLVAYIGSLLA